MAQNLVGLLDLRTYQPGWSGSFVDRRDHAPGVAQRPQRTPLKGIVLHRIGDAEHAPVAEGRDVDSIIRFFTQDPEGVATVTMDGSYDSKVPTMEKWRASGIPAANLARAFVPYAFLIEPSGAVSQLLPLEAVGAHAPGYNQSGIGVAFIGDFRTDPPTPAQVDSGVAVCVALLLQNGGSPHAQREVQILGHDETRPTPKLCPGPNFPLQQIKQRILAALPTP